MILRKRAFLFYTGMLLTMAKRLRADDRLDYKDYDFIDYYSKEFQAKGTFPSLQQDIDEANRIISSLPTEDYVQVLQKLAALSDKGSTGESFNTRWKTYANPLIVRFFHDIGYKRTPYPGDCTSWCAATISWCLKRTGYRIPSDPASSQSYLHYGTKLTKPSPGDLCVFTDVGDQSHGHVGVYVSQSGETLQILGGNQSGSSATNCGPGYRESKIDVTEIPINSGRQRSVGIHYLSAYVRPTK